MCAPTGSFGGGGTDAADGGSAEEGSPEALLSSGAAQQEAAQQGQQQQPQHRPQQQGELQQGGQQEQQQEADAFLSPWELLPLDTSWQRVVQSLLPCMDAAAAWRAQEAVGQLRRMVQATAADSSEQPAQGTQTGGSSLAGASASSLSALAAALALVDTAEAGPAAGWTVATAQLPPVTAGQWQQVVSVPLYLSRPGHSRC